MDGLLYLNSLPIFDSNNNTADVSEDGCGATNGSSKENAAERETEAGAAAAAGAAAPADTGGGSKYSLRPRTQRRQRSHEDSTEDEDGKCSRAASPEAGGGGGARRRGGGGGGRRARRRQPQPLSRYRRRTANARERERMREINAAFEALRRALPPLAAPAAPESEEDDASEEQQRAGEKVTKVATLRLAIRYITELTRALETVSHAPPSPPAALPGAAPPQQQQQQQEMFSVPYSALQTQPQPQTGSETALQLGAVGLPPVSTLILPQGAFFAGDAAAGCEQLLTPPPSLTPSSSLGADCVAPTLDEAWPPPDLCLTPPPLLDDAFLTHR